MSSPWPSIHNNLNLYITDQYYTLLPANDHQSRSLSINRANSLVSLAPPGPPPKFDRSVTNLAGILGIIRLLKSDYLVLIQSARKVTHLFNTSVYTPTKFSVYPISLEPNLSLLENFNERYLLSILKSQLDHAITRVFFTYHSKSNSNDFQPWDLTKTLQRQLNPPKNLSHSSSPSNDHLNENAKLDHTPAPWNQSDDRFFWNKFIQSRLISLASQPGNQEASKFILPVIFGFLEFKTAMIGSQKISFGIISRRSRYRAGTRYYSRGVNSEGHVSNFNETEMIFTTFPPDSSNNNNQTKINSNSNAFVTGGFVQTRGSVPLFWTEINNLRYRPDLKIVDTSQSFEAMKAHFDHQINIYGDQYLVNLINSSGYEKAIKDGYEKGVGALNNPRVHYTYFDFHKECKGLRFDKVQILIDQLRDDIIDQGYFLQESSIEPSITSPSKVQKSVIRSNCMDCLDRTNVVQSAIAKWVLTNQLKQAGILPQEESLDAYPDFMYLFRNLWADNANAISKSYSGTAALKTDFTRSGIRTTKGAVDDGMNSAMRYIKNNFMDGPRQDSYDLFTGAWVPSSLSSSSDSQCPSDNTPISPSDVSFRGPYDNHYLQAILVSFVIFLLIFISFTFSKKRSFKLSIISFIFLALITRYIFRHGMEFVNQPRLKSSNTNQIRKLIIDFPGPSSRSFESSKYGRIKIDFELFDRLFNQLNNLLHSFRFKLQHNGQLHSNLINSNKNSSNILLDHENKKRKD